MGNTVRSLPKAGSCTICDSPSLEVGNVTLLLAPSHSSLLADNALVVQIDFVADNHEGEVVGIARSGLPRILAFNPINSVDRSNLKPQCTLVQ